MDLIGFGTSRPVIGPECWIAENATLIGDVTLGRGVSLWFGSVLRADGDSIDVGDRSNIQDGCVLHTDPGHPVSIGEGVSVGHRAVLHGCVIGDNVIVGMSSTVMNGAVIGANSLVAAGAVVLEGTEVPPGSLVAGVPAKVRRTLDDSEIAALGTNADEYATLARRYADDAETVTENGQPT